MLPYGAHPALFLHNPPGALPPFAQSLPLGSLSHVPVHGPAQHIQAIFQSPALPVPEGVPRVLQEVPPAAQKLQSEEANKKATHAKTDRKTATNAADGDSSVNSFAGISDVNSFAKKLYHMVTTSNQNILSFTSDGLSFEVKDPKKLERQVLPKYFRHSRFQSLVRQLNFYNFKKTSKEKDEWVYTHSLFQRDRPDLLESVRRKPTTVPKARPAPPPDSPPASPRGGMQYYPYNNSSPLRGAEGSGAGSDHRCPPSPPTHNTRAASLRRGRRAAGRSRPVVREYVSSSDEEEEGEEAMLSSDDEREFMEVPGFGGRACVQEEEDEEEDGEGDAEVPLLLSMRAVIVNAAVSGTVAAAVTGGVKQVDLSPYSPSAEDVSLWEGVRGQWAAVVGGHGDEALALSERLPLSHVDLCRFFLSTPPHSSGAQVWAALCGLLRSCGALLGPLQEHVDALHAYGGPRGKEGRRQQEEAGEALLDMLREREAGLSAEAMCVLRPLLADALNHLREAVCSLAMDDAARSPLEASMDLWMHHATRFF